jgi:hypothetical protein
MLLDLEEHLHWPPHAWRRMGAREFFARYTRLCERAEERVRKAESERWFADQRSKSIWQ